MDALSGHKEDQAILTTLAQNWWAIVLRGVFAVIFGVGAFIWPAITLAALVLLYGEYPGVALLFFLRDRRFCRLEADLAMCTVTERLTD